MRSLSLRLLLVSSLIVGGFLLVVGFALERAFVASVSRAEGEKLQSSILLLLAAAEVDKEQIVMPPAFEDARFNQIDSGLYGLVYNEQGEELWRSPSAMLLDADVGPRVTQLQVGQVSNQETTHYLIAARGVQWEAESGKQHYNFFVLESSAPFLQELAQFRRQLWLPLLVAGALLLLAQPLLLRWGLRPLRRLASDIAAVESGVVQRVPEGHVSELQPLAENLNTLLDHESQLRARYTQRLDDLAHSLKTPLAVMSGALRDEAEQKLVLTEQLAAMDEIVQYQLRRATGGGAVVAGEHLALDELLQKLRKTLDKVYQDKGVSAHWQIEAGLTLRGDKRDFMELFGNLIDNAYKYCHRQVSVGISGIPGKAGFTLQVDDDGAGVAPESRDNILRRGHRLDSSMPGQGIGLAVVMDIMDAYGLVLEISESAQLGGARFTLRNRPE